MNDQERDEEVKRLINKALAPKPVIPDQKALYKTRLVETLAMKAFLILDERLKGDNKALVNAVMSLMLYSVHSSEHKGLVNWWDNQMAGEAILEIVTRVKLEVE